MSTLKNMVYGLGILNIFISCEQKYSNEYGGYRIRVEELNSYAAFCELGDGAFDNGELGFDDISREEIVCKIILEKIDDSDTYVQMRYTESYRVNISSFITGFGVVCPDSMYREITNYDIFGGGYNGDYYVKLNKGCTLSTIWGKYRTTHKSWILKECLYFHNIVIFDKTHKKATLMIYDSKRNVLYPSLEEWSHNYNFIPKISKKIIQQDYDLLNKQVGQDFQSDFYKKYAIDKDTFIFFGGYKFKNEE